MIIVMIVGAWSRMGQCTCESDRSCAWLRSISISTPH